MSLILDALKKAEQDRQAGQAPALDEVLVRRPPSAAVRRRHAQQDLISLAAIGLALLFAVAGLIYWLWPSAAPSATVAVASAPPSPASTEIAEPIAPQPALRVDPERLEAPVADVPDEGIDTGDTGAAQAMTMDDLDGDTPQVSPTKPAPQTAAQPAAAERQPTAAPAPLAPAPAASEPPVSVVAEPPPAPRPAAEPLVRPLKEMPPAFRSEFPKLTVDVHVYDSNPLRRFVLINGKKYRETDTLLDGPRLIEIMPNGVVVEQRGSKVLLELPR